MVVVVVVVVVVAAAALSGWAAPCSGRSAGCQSAETDTRGEREAPNLKA